MRGASALVAVLLAAGAGFAAGYLPELRKRAGAEERTRASAAELAQARAALRIHSIYDQLLDLGTLAARGAPGAPEPGPRQQALRASTEFFDQVRKEGMGSASAQTKAALAGILERRDALTAALARGDPAVAPLLEEVRGLLRTVLAAAAGDLAAPAPGAPPPEAAGPEGPAAPQPHLPASR